MKNEQIKKDPFVQYLIEEGGMEQPGEDFTKNIMGQLDQTPQNSFSYQPVISRAAWIVLTVVGVGLFLVLSVMTPQAGNEPLDFFGYAIHVDFSFFTYFIHKISLSFELSPVMKTSLGALAFFSLFQLLIYELKRKSFYK